MLLCHRPKVNPFTIPSSVSFAVLNRCAICLLPELFSYFVAAEMNLEKQNKLRRFILDAVVTVFCVTLVTHTSKGIKMSRTKLVYCVFLLFVFSANICINTEGPLRNYTYKLYPNVIKELSLQVMLNMQMLSPIVQLIANIATERIVIKGIETFANINHELSFLGYRLDFNDVQFAWKVFTLAIIVFGSVMFVDILTVLNMNTELKPVIALKMHLLYMVCAAFDLTNQVYQIKTLQYFAQAAFFLKRALQDKLHRGKKNAMNENLRHIRNVFALLSKGCEAFNRKYSIFLLFTCLKTVITVAPCLCTVLVERFVRVYVSNDFISVYSHFQYSLDVLSLTWLTYQLIYILFVINVFDCVAEKVRFFTLSVS